MLDSPRGRSARAFWRDLRPGWLVVRAWIILAAIAARSGLREALWIPTLTHNDLQDLSLLVGAVVLSVCSEADAFIAAGLTQFSLTARLAFLVVGPMIDLKLGALYMGTYRKGFLRTAMIAIFATTLVLTLWVQVVFG